MITKQLLSIVIWSILLSQSLYSMEQSTYLNKIATDSAQLQAHYQISKATFNFVNRILTSSTNNREMLNNLLQQTKIKYEDLNQLYNTSNNKVTKLSIHAQNALISLARNPTELALTLHDHSLLTFINKLAATIAHGGGIQKIAFLFGILDNVLILHELKQVNILESANEVFQLLHDRTSSFARERIERIAYATHLRLKDRTAIKTIVDTILDSSYLTISAYDLIANHLLSSDQKNVFQKLNEFINHLLTLDAKQWNELTGTLLADIFIFWTTRNDTNTYATQIPIDQISVRTKSIDALNKKKEQSSTLAANNNNNAQIHNKDVNVIAATADDTLVQRTINNSSFSEKDGKLIETPPIENKPALTQSIAQLDHSGIGRIEEEEFRKIDTNNNNTTTVADISTQPLAHHQQFIKGWASTEKHSNPQIPQWNNFYNEGPQHRSSATSQQQQPIANTPPLTKEQSQLINTVKNGDLPAAEQALKRLEVIAPQSPLLLTAQDTLRNRHFSAALAQNQVQQEIKPLPVPENKKQDVPIITEPSKASAPSVAQTIEQTTDLVSTSPSSAIQLKIDTAIEHAMHALNDKEYADFLAHMEQAHTTILQTQKSGADNFIRTATIRGIKCYFSRLTPNNPLHNPKEFLINTAQNTLLIAFNMVTGGIFLPIEKAGAIASQLQELRKIDPSKMTVEQYIDLVAETLADCTWLMVSNKVGQKIIPAKAQEYIISLPSIKHELQAPMTHNQKPPSTQQELISHAVTPEGLVIDTKQEAALAEELAESMVMKSTTEKVKDTTQGTAEIPKPLDYGHSEIQYKQLKNTLKEEQFTSIIKCSKHGLERLIERKFEPEEVLSLLTKPDYLRIQNDGAKVFIQKIGNRYRIIVFNEETGEIITALKETTEKKIISLGENYGWKL